MTITTFDVSTAWEIRYSRRHRYCKALMWLPDSGVFTDPFRLVFNEHGGARTNPGQMELGTNLWAQMLVNDMGCALVSYDYRPGGFYKSDAQEPGGQFWPENIRDGAECIQHVKTRYGEGGPGLYGIPPGGGSLTLVPGSCLTDPDDCCVSGDSSGAWGTAITQMQIAGTFPYVRGPVLPEHDYYTLRENHLANVVWFLEGQISLSQFVESRISVAAGYLVNHGGGYGIGVTSIVVDTGTGAMYAGNVITFAGHATEYIIAADYAGGAGTLTVMLGLTASVADNEAITHEDQAIDKYDTYGWAGSYFYDSRDVANGLNWRTFPMDVKRAADVDYYLSLTGERTQSTKWFFIGPGNNMNIENDPDTGNPKSFLNWWTPGVRNILHTNLHSEHQQFWMYYTLQAYGNSATWMFAGNSTNNPDTATEQLAAGVGTYVPAGITGTRYVGSATTRATYFKEFLIHVAGWPDRTGGP